jgi:hypothetical protein
MVCWLFVLLLLMFHNSLVFIAYASLESWHGVRWNLRLLIFLRHFFVQFHWVGFLADKFEFFFECSKGLGFVCKFDAFFFWIFERFLRVDCVIYWKRGFDASEGGIAAVARIYLDVLKELTTDLLVLFYTLHQFYFIYETLKLSKRSTKNFNKNYL